MKVELWFFQRLLSEEIKYLEDCVLMRSPLSEKFTVIRGNGEIYWRCLKDISNPDILISPNAWNKYKKNVQNELNGLIPYVLEQLNEEYIQLQKQLYILYERAVNNPNGLLYAQIHMIQQHMYPYEVVSMWMQGRFPCIHIIGEVKGALVFIFKFF